MRRKTGVKFSVRVCICDVRVFVCDARVMCMSWCDHDTRWVWYFCNTKSVGWNVRHRTKWHHFVMEGCIWAL